MSSAVRKGKTDQNEVPLPTYRNAYKAKTRPHQGLVRMPRNRTTHTLLVGAKWCSHLDTVCHFLKKLNTQLPHDPATAA